MMPVHIIQNLEVHMLQRLSSHGFVYPELYILHAVR